MHSNSGRENFKDWGHASELNVQEWNVEPQPQGDEEENSKTWNEASDVISDVVSFYLKVDYDESQLYVKNTEEST